MQPPTLLEQQRRCHSGSGYYRFDLLLDKSFLHDSSTVTDSATQLIFIFFYLELQIYNLLPVEQ